MTPALQTRPDDKGVKRFEQFVSSAGRRGTHANSEPHHAGAL